MDLIYTEPYSTIRGIKDLGYIANCQCDLEIGAEATNDFEITIDTQDLHGIEKGSLIYADDDSEYGGMVYGLKVNTSTEEVIVKSKLWRGMLTNQIVCPPTGQSYYTYTGDANQAVRLLIDGRFGGLIKGASKSANINISIKSRYETVLKTLENALTQSGARLKITWDGTCAICGAVPINDLSDKISLDNDYGIPIVAEDSDGYNHILALGQGELIERQVVELWLLEDGTITDDPTHPDLPKGLSLRTYLYDYPSIETADALKREARKKLEEVSSTKTLEISPGDLNVEIGDIVSASERITGITMKKQVTRKIIKGEIRNGISFLTTEYKVGD